MTPLTKPISRRGCTPCYGRTLAAWHDRLRDTARHQDLLDQVATSEYERREVRRILGGPLTERDLDAHAEWKASPAGTCPRTHQPCVTPQACELAEPGARQTLRGRDAWRAVALVLACCGAAAATLAALI